MSYLQLAKDAAARRRMDLPRYESNEGHERSTAACGIGRVGHDVHATHALPFLGMRLDEFQSQGALLNIRVPWLSATLWMVPGEQDVATLVDEGVSRGRIWTSRELIDLFSGSEVTLDHIKTVALAKLEFAGEVVEVRPP